MSNLPGDFADIEAEAGIVATVISSPEYVYYSESLQPAHFYNEFNGLVYEAVRACASKNKKTIQPYDIMQELENQDLFNNVKQLFEFSQTGEIVQSSIDGYKDLVSKVLDSAFKRSLYNQLNLFMSNGFSGPKADIERDLYNRIDEITSGYAYIDEVPVFGDQVDELWSDLEARQNGTLMGIPFKYKTLNEYVSIEPCELVVVAAKAKGAKSIFMLNEAVHALRNGKSVLYIDSELSDRMFFTRLLAHLTGIRFYDVKTGNYDDAGRAKIEEAKREIKSWPFSHLYIPIFTIDAIYIAVKTIAHKFDGKLDLLIVDYIKSTNTVGAWESYAELGKVTDFIKNDIAGKLQIAALAAAQLTENNKLADSAKIVRNASTIIMMLDKTSEEIAEDGEECGNKKLVVTQNRNGQQHAPGEYIDIKFEGDYIKLEEARQHTPNVPY